MYVEEWEECKTVNWENESEWKVRLRLEMSGKKKRAEWVINLYVRGSWVRIDSVGVEEHKVRKAVCKLWTFKRESQV